MKKTKMQKGITLIALIITIVVLLIIAVVAIGTVKESGIIGHAQTARSKYEEEKAKEEGTITEYEELIESKLPGGNNGSGSKVTYTDEGVPVPSGFYYVTGTKDTGFVISDNPADENNASGRSGNQFVWVPVTTIVAAYGLNTNGYREPDVVTGATPSETVDSASGTSQDAVSSNLERAGCTTDLTGDEKVNAYDFKKQLENEFNLMAESVNKYDGFYVGRYEVSFSTERKAQSKGSTEAVPVYSAINLTTSSNNNNATDWYGLYALCKTYNTSSAKSSMIWGSQYDAMMTWMGDAANTTITGYNKDRTCGTAQNDVIKNVYDIYGNSHEWTIEANYSSVRVGRGRSLRC